MASLRPGKVNLKLERTYVRLGKPFLRTERGLHEA